MTTAIRTNPLSYLTDQLNELKAKGTHFKLRVLDDEQAPVCTFDGKKVINLASNNYLGLTTHPKLREAALEATRKFGVGSGATALIESRGKPITDWSYPGKYKQIQAYADAKLLALMYTYAQARRHEGEGLTFNAVSPGAVKTSLGSKACGSFKTIQALTNPFVGPPEKGSRGCVRLMSDPELRRTATGGYYSSAKLKKSSRVPRPRGPGTHVRPDRAGTAHPQLRRPQPAIASIAGAATLAPSLTSGSGRIGLV